MPQVQSPCQPQPAFGVTKNANQNDIAVGSNVTVTWETEIFDQNADFASNTFTAPVAGRYQLNLSLRLQNLDSASAYYDITIVTSNRAYQWLQDPDYGQDNAYEAVTLSALADMDAGDTALVNINQANGTAQTDIQQTSHFNGYLVC